MEKNHSEKSLVSSPQALLTRRGHRPTCTTISGKGHGISMTDLTDFASSSRGRVGSKLPGAHCFLKSEQNECHS